MIWNPPAKDDPSSQALAAYLTDEIGLAYRRELSEAIAEFIKREHPTFTASARPAPFNRQIGLPTEYLLLMIGRALWSVGEELAARELLELELRALNLPEAFVEAACSADVSVAHWHILLASRALRTSSLSAPRQDPLWVLDLERMIAPRPASLELLALNVVRTVIDRVAALWDRCQGRGLLGLAHAERVASGILGCPRRSAKCRALSAEIRAEVEQRLQMLKKARGWQETPRVIMLDL